MNQVRGCLSLICVLNKIQTRNGTFIKFIRGSASGPAQTKNNILKSFDEIPGPPDSNSISFMLKYMPMFGGYNLEKIHEIGFEKYKQYGLLRKENIPKRFSIVIPYDPDDIEKVFRNEGKCPMRSTFGIAKYHRMKNKDKYHGNYGLFTEDVEEWYSIRSKTQASMMRPKVIMSYLPILSNVGDDMIKLMKTIRREDLKIDNFMKVLYNWAFESLGTFALDVRFGCLVVDYERSEETKKMIETINNNIIGMSKCEIGFPLWKYFPTKGYRLFVKSQEELRLFTVQRIEQIRERLRDYSENDNLSFLENLIHQNKLTEGELICFIIDLFMAGVDTTSHSIAFLLYNLSKNPEAQEKLYSEINSVLGDSDDITTSDLEDMKYLKACLKESLRITHTVIGTSRILDKDIVLKDYLIPRNTLFILHSMVVANLEAMVDKPSKFIPERWLKEESMPSTHKFAFFPFGYGPRMCIGKRLAELEMHILIVKILRNFKVSYEGEMGIITRIVNIPDKPLSFKFADRGRM